MRASCVGLALVVGAVVAAAVREDPPKNCQALGSITNCTALDHNAYCGTSAEPAANFNDGTGCSCDFGYKYDKTTKTCTGTPPPGGSYCGTTWADASTCRHSQCETEDDCSKGMNCFAHIPCRF